MRRKHKAKARPAGKLLGDYLRGHPGAAAVLHKHGINVCSGCFITFFSTPEKAAAYHAVPDPAAFARDLRRAAARKRR